MMGIGEWAALAAALMWTIASMIWGRIHLSAWGINLCKNVIGSLIVAIHLALLAIVMGQSILSAPIESWFWLGLSGLIGIVVGDTLYFRCLQILGPRRALMLATTGPIFSVILGWIILRESLLLLAVVGIFLAVAGVFIVVADRQATKEAPGLMPGRIRIGLAAGMASAICQAVGGVLSKMGMRSSDGVEICGALDATFIRLVVSALAMLMIVAARRQLSTVAQRVRHGRMLKLLIPATAFGTWLGIWFSQVAYNHTDVAVAQTLLSTCPLFAIPIVWLVYRHRVTVLSLVGTLVALVGIALVVKFS